VPSLLIPLPSATDDHQRRNAEALRRVGAAELLEQRDVSGSSLAATIAGLLNDEPRRRAMSDAAARAARRDAAQVIADRIGALAAAYRHQ
jgi:UDP-N-acetylglucosamine--N-acetylmuramyl-(pentapeptide) pyrophosphoryl-undecaprenol N-acetylglucosamine transferase